MRVMSLENRKISIFHFVCVWGGCIVESGPDYFQQLNQQAVAMLQ